jgi:DNA-binding winged helix-turn-helix (wHTH) protein
MNTPKEKEPPERYVFGPFVLEGRELWREDELGSREYIGLQPKSLKILALLVGRAGKAVSRDVIIDEVFEGEDRYESSINTRISEIRNRLGDDAKNPTYIETLNNKCGYRIKVKVEAERPTVPELALQRQDAFSGFNELDSIHVHIDGGNEGALVSGMVFRLDREGKHSKINKVKAFTKGPQRDDDPEDYVSHTPGGLDSENLQYFSTHLFGNFAETKSGLRQLLAGLDEATDAGMVVEAERIIGKFSDDGRVGWSSTYIHEYPVLCSGDVGYKVSKTKPIEIHYAIDIPKEGTWLHRHPLDLATLPDFTADLGIRVGGWFLFDKRDQKKWAYRSNMFVLDVPPEEVEAHRLRLKAAVEELGQRERFTCTVRALVEHSIGIWNTPLERSECRRSVKELSDWEAKYPNLRDFWVVTPNFLGDKEEYVQSAMIRNLQHRGVTYTYFLQSVADYNRLLSLAEDLERKLRPHVRVYDLIQAVLVLRNASTESALETVFRQSEGQGCFIANPLPAPDGIDDADGYMLEKSDVPGQISGGRVMTRGQTNEVVELLKPLVPNGHPLQGYSMRLGHQKNEEHFGVTIICVGLKGLPELLNDVDDAAIAQQLREYDLLVAAETSKHGGHVVRSIELGYLLLFGEPSEAWLCARQLQRGDASHNQRVAIDLGGVWRVTRAHGIDYCGKTVARCRELLRKVKYGGLYTTDSFRNELAKKYSAALVPAEEELVFERSRIKIWKLKT